MFLEVELPKHPIGTKFIYKRNGRHSTPVNATIIGYHIEHNTDTNKTDVTYRIAYNFAGLQDMTATVARSTVDMAVVS